MPNKIATIVAMIMLIIILSFLENIVSLLNRPAKIQIICHLENTDNMSEKRPETYVPTFTSVICPMINQMDLSFDLAVFRNECLHHCPSDEICDSADAEYYHISGLLAFKTEEGECCTCIFRICEEHTGSLVYEE